MQEFKNFKVHLEKYDQWFLQKWYQVDITEKTLKKNNFD